MYSDVISANWVFTSDKIINNSDNFRIKCLSYSKIIVIFMCSLFSVFTLFIFLMWENFIFPVIFDTCDVLYNFHFSVATYCTYIYLTYCLFQLDSFIIIILYYFSFFPFFHPFSYICFFYYLIFLYISFHCDILKTVEWLSSLFFLSFFKRKCKSIMTIKNIKFLATFLN